MPKTRHYRMIALGTLFAILFLTASGRRASALSCVERGFGNEYREADAVFVGRIVDLDGDFSKLPTVTHTRVLRFRVEAAWKGVQDRDVSIRVGGDDRDLPILLRYYVFAQHDAQTGELFTWACTGPAPANLYEDDIREVLEDQQRLELHGIAPLPSIRAWRSLAAILWFDLKSIWPNSTGALVAQTCLLVIAIGIVRYQLARRLQDPS